MFKENIAISIWVITSFSSIKSHYLCLCVTEPYVQAKELSGQQHNHRPFKTGTEHMYIGTSHLSHQQRFNVNCLRDAFFNNRFFFASVLTRHLRILPLVDQADRFQGFDGLQSSLPASQKSNSQTWLGLASSQTATVTSCPAFPSPESRQSRLPWCFSCPLGLSVHLWFWFFSLQAAIRTLLLKYNLQICFIYGSSYRSLAIVMALGYLSTHVLVAELAQLADSVVLA